MIELHGSYNEINYKLKLNEYGIAILNIHGTCMYMIVTPMLCHHLHACRHVHTVQANIIKL